MEYLPIHLCHEFMVNGAFLRCFVFFEILLCLLKGVRIGGVDLKTQL